jgi:YesN/AraC family two-component response regulator
MHFELLPIIDIVLDLYQKPRTSERFQSYLATLQGNTKGDLSIPIGGFNPMAKESTIEKLLALKALDIENMMTKTLESLNEKIKKDNHYPTVKVAFNLSDDLHGSWTNRYTSDYDAKFNINALFKRNFCVPVFWTSETYTIDDIKQTTLEYCYRTIYWQSHPKPKTLEEHIAQEFFVAKNTKKVAKINSNFDSLHNFFQKNKNSEDQNLIFNFLYGDEASASLGRKTLEIEMAYGGFEYAKFIANL